MTDFVIVDDLRQYHLEDFEDEYWKRRDKTTASLQVFQSVEARARSCLRPTS